MNHKSSSFSLTVLVIHFIMWSLKSLCRPCNASTHIKRHMSTGKPFQHTCLTPASPLLLTRHTNYQVSASGYSVWMSCSASSIELLVWGESGSSESKLSIFTTHFGQLLLVGPNIIHSSSRSANHAINITKTCCSYH